MTIDTALPELNSELLFKLIKWAEHDEAWIKHLQNIAGEWNQGHWGYNDSDDIPDAPRGEWEGTLVDFRNSCGTAYCLAGGAAVETGHRLLFADWDGSAERCIKVEATSLTDEKGHTIYRDVPDTVADISDTGEKVLGFTVEEADDMFNGDNTIDYLKARANGCCEDRGLPVLFPEIAPTRLPYSGW